MNFHDLGKFCNLLNVWVAMIKATSGSPNSLIINSVPPRWALLLSRSFPKFPSCLEDTELVVFQKVNGNCPRKLWRTPNPNIRLLASIGCFFFVVLPDLLEEHGRVWNVPELVKMQ